MYSRKNVWYRWKRKPIRFSITVAISVAYLVPLILCFNLVEGANTEKNNSSNETDDYYYTDDTSGENNKTIKLSNATLASTSDEYYYYVEEVVVRAKNGTTLSRNVSHQPKNKRKKKIPNSASSNIQEFEEMMITGNDNPGLPPLLPTQQSAAQQFIAPFHLPHPIVHTEQNHYPVDETIHPNNISILHPYDGITNELFPSNSHPTSHDDTENEGELLRPPLPPADAPQNDVEHSNSEGVRDIEYIDGIEGFGGEGEYEKTKEIGLPFDSEYGLHPPLGSIDDPHSNKIKINTDFIFNVHGWTKTSPNPILKTKTIFAAFLKNLLSLTTADLIFWTEKFFNVVSELAIPKEHYLRVISFAGVYLFISLLAYGKENLSEIQCKVESKDMPLKSWKYHAGRRFVAARSVDPHMQQKLLDIFRGIDDDDDYEDDLPELSSKGVSSEELSLDDEISHISDLCPKEAFFYSLNPRHIEAYSALKQIFVSQSSPEEVVALSKYLLKKEKVHPKVWYIAIIGASLSRQDMTGFTVAHPLDAIPDWYIPADLISDIMDKYKRIRVKRSAVPSHNHSRNTTIIRNKPFRYFSYKKQMKVPPTRIPNLTTKLVSNDEPFVKKPSIASNATVNKPLNTTHPSGSTNISSSNQTDGNSTNSTNKTTTTTSTKPPKIVTNITTTTTTIKTTVPSTSSSTTTTTTSTTTKTNATTTTLKPRKKITYISSKIPTTKPAIIVGTVHSSTTLASKLKGDKGELTKASSKNSAQFDGIVLDDDDHHGHRHKKKGKKKGKKGKKGCIKVDWRVGIDNGVENELWYFREDLMLNQHHWYWHQTHPLNSTQHADRRAELFFYMHRAFVARYNAERLSNGLRTIRPLNFRQGGIIHEGYNSHLADINSGKYWTPRWPETPLADIYHDHDPDFAENITLRGYSNLYGRLVKAIKTGKLLTGHGGIVSIDHLRGIEPLANTVEASDLSVNPRYYNPMGIHGLGHVMVGLSSDPDFRFRRVTGIMSEAAVSMRDPSFYAYHLFMDNFFELHKTQLAPYQRFEGDFPLLWKGVELVKIELHSQGGGPANELRTFWTHHKFELSPGVDRSIDKGDHAKICAQHLDHEPFHFKIVVVKKPCVKNKSGKATIRIFMAPRYDEKGHRIPVKIQRRLMFPLDSFPVKLRVGKNIITRYAEDSALTQPWTKSIRDMERGPDPSGSADFCGCGWPQHLYIPKGHANGMPFDLFAMVTNYDEDFVPNNPKDLEIPETCNSPYLFCGLPRRMYPDRRPMGYPFDRPLFKSLNCPPGWTFASVVCQTINLIINKPIDTLEEYVSKVPNMRMLNFHIKHLDTFFPEPARHR